MIDIELPMDGEPVDVLWRIADCLKFVQSVPDNGDLCPAANAGRNCILACLEEGLRQLANRKGLMT